MILDQSQKDTISNLIEQIETKSSAELVAVIAQKSGEYASLWALISAFIMFIGSFVGLLFVDVGDMHIFLWFQLLVFCGFYLLFYMYEDFFIKYLPKDYRYSKASLFAYKSFNNLGLNKTKTKAGIMFFVSIDEKYVTIITDSAIKAKLHDEYWEAIVRDFIRKVKNGEFTKGYIEAIEGCSKVLIEKFPIQEDDENELPNEVIELL